MSSLKSCKKVELHLHLEGAASPQLVRDICKSNFTQIPEIFDKAGNYKWQNFDQFLTIYEIVTNLFLEEKHFEALVRHVLDKQVKEHVIYTEIFLGPHLWSDKPSSRWARFLEIASYVADEYRKKSKTRRGLKCFEEYLQRKEKRQRRSRDHVQTAVRSRRRMRWSRGCGGQTRSRARCCTRRYW